MPTYELIEPTPEELERKAVIPDDTPLNVRITAFEQKVKPWTDDEGNEVQRLEWTFVVTDGEYAKRKVWGETGVKFYAHPECKLYSWVASLLGTEIPTGYSFNTDNLLNIGCRIVVGVREYTKKGETEVKQVNFVKDVFPAKTSGLVGANDPF